VARVALDADVVIAFLDAGDEQHERAVDLLRPLLGGGTEIAIGASVYAEVMVRPLASGSGGRVDEFVDAIGATVLAIDRELARRAAGLRARHRTLRLADALSLATAITAGAELLTSSASRCSTRPATASRASSWRGSWPPSSGWTC
jgi:predicted nucleic acid-binding protein